ncbi:MAG: 2-oxoacid:acceptor oxidoreductase subunit alpha [Bacillota bacterium]
MNLQKNILIGGEAGQGLQTVAGILGKTLFRLGYEVFTTKDYMSRVRGGHNFIKIVFGDESISAPSKEIDLIIALNEKSIKRHQDKLKDNGVILFEDDKDFNKVVKVDAQNIASEINIKGKNTVYIGAALKYFGLSLDECNKVIEESFSDEKIVNDNIELLKKGFESIEANEKVKEISENDNRIYIDGNTAVGYGAISAGLSYYSAYPMSPSTGIMNYVASKQEELGIVVEQAEDEIAAINMALGASYGGIRAMTGTSGGGLSLMAESIGLAAITETPLVIANVQRPGPATGLPTRTEQGDLLFAINISQGDIPLMVIAPRDHEDAFYQTIRAHNLAEKYQIPVIILSDQYLADSTVSIDEFDFSKVEINRHLIDKKDGDDYKNYKRYEFTEDGISPRVYPGLLKGETVLADSDEHDEKGHIVEESEKRIKMTDKRMKKLEKLIDEDLLKPELYANDNIDYLFLSWGSTFGVLKETVDLLEEDNINAGVLSYSDIWPLEKEEIKKWAKKDITLIDVENNATAQFARLLRSETGVHVDNKILKYDGRPFTVEEIYNRFLSEVK